MPIFAQDFVFLDYDYESGKQILEQYFFSDLTCSCLFDKDTGLVRFLSKAVTRDEVSYFITLPHLYLGHTIKGGHKHEL